MNVAALHTFVTVAELSSFSRAAERLHLAQPAVSQQIKRLERDIGAELFHRSTRRVRLTAAGELLLPRARSILADVDRAEVAIRRLAAGLSGRVSIGFVGTATYDLLPRVARSVRANLPDIELELHGEQLSPALTEALISRSIDIAVTRDPAPDPQLTVRHLRSEPLVAVLPADHPEAARDVVALASLRDSTFVTHPSGHRSVMYDAVMHACRQAGFLPTEVVEVRETATLVTFVAAGIGVALVPEPVRSLAVEGVAFRGLADITDSTELVLATRADETSPAVAQVVDVILASSLTESSGMMGHVAGSSSGRNAVGP